MLYSQERILGWPYLRLDQRFLSRLAEHDDVIRGPPFLVMPRAPPTLNPQLSLTQAYPRLLKRAMVGLIPFATSYLCQSGFSALLAIKTKQWNTLDVKNDMHVRYCSVEKHSTVSCSCWKKSNNLRIKTNSLKLICAKLILRVFSTASNIFFLIAFLLVFYECFYFWFMLKQMFCAFIVVKFS